MGQFDKLDRLDKLLIIYHNVMKTEKNGGEQGKTGKLSLYLLEFEQAPKDLLKVKPGKNTKTQDDKTSKG